MGVFKKLTGADVRVTPLQIKFKKTETGDDIVGTNGLGIRSGYTGENVNSEGLVYSSIRQLYYGAFFEQNFSGEENSIFSNGAGAGTTVPTGEFSRYDPSFQGSGPYSRNLGNSIKVKSIDTTNFGESIVPGSVSGSGFTDDRVGNLRNSSNSVVGNIFYDQGILVRTDGSNLGTIEYSGSYTIYATQYKCTAEPHEFNYTLNPTALSSSATDYDPDLINSSEFMPYVTTIGLYNENQELIMVGKLAQAVKLNPYTNTNFIVRLDR